MNKSRKILYAFSATVVSLALVLGVVLAVQHYNKAKADAPADDAIVAQAAEKQTVAEATAMSISDTDEVDENISADDKATLREEYQKNYDVTSLADAVLDASIAEFDDTLSFDSFPFDLNGENMALQRANALVKLGLTTKKNFTAVAMPYESDKDDAAALLHEAIARWISNPVEFNQMFEGISHRIILDQENIEYFRWMQKYSEEIEDAFSRAEDDPKAGINMWVEKRSDGWHTTAAYKRTVARMYAYISKCAYYGVQAKQTTLRYILLNDSDVPFIRAIATKEAKYQETMDSIVLGLFDVKSGKRLGKLFGINYYDGAYVEFAVKDKAATTNAVAKSNPEPKKPDPTPNKPDPKPRKGGTPSVTAKDEEKTPTAKEEGGTPKVTSTNAGGTPRITTTGTGGGGGYTPPNNPNNDGKGVKDPAADPVNNGSAQTWGGSNKSTDGAGPSETTPTVEKNSGTGYTGQDTPRESLPAPGTTTTVVEANGDTVTTTARETEGGQVATDVVTTHTDGTQERVNNDQVSSDPIPVQSNPDADGTAATNTGMPTMPD